jgi:hypothetical protein
LKRLALCLPRPAKRPPAGPGWIHEIKHDGFRILAERRSRSLACESCHARVVLVRPSFPTSLSARNLVESGSSCRGGLRRFDLLAVIIVAANCRLKPYWSALRRGATCRRRRNTASSPRNVLAGQEPPDQTGSAESSGRWRRFGLKPQPDQRRTHVALRSDHAGYWVSSMLTTTCAAAAYGSNLHHRRG